ncbi:hypothetical protein IAD21_05571 [Abditibacteriota bacterium]|nr:hypothetical protein IAD21_05571 [Abditibacteriota bacterium]
MNSLKIALALFVPLTCPCLLLLAQAAPPAYESGAVLPGVDVLQQRGFGLLRGQRVGLVTNQTGRNRAGMATIDILRRAPGVQLVALYAPEHGIRGKVEAGAGVRNGRDAPSGLPIYSLYGATRQPTAAMLRGVQTLVFDMQDVGARSYTFLATLEKCRQACAAHNIPLVVLDRPNPLGRTIEGNIPQKFSFVCPFPIPYRYGLTVGEVALWLNARARKKCLLKVVPLQNYKGQTFSQTGLLWTRSSPNIPRSSSAFFYAATGILGELPALSVGIGTPWPFEVVGAPGLDAQALAARLNSRPLRGWKFRPATWVPSHGRYSHKRCQGVYIELTDERVAQATRLNFEIFMAVRQVAPKLGFFRSSRHNALFDTVCGTLQVRRLMQREPNANTLWLVWNRGAVKFQQQTYKFRLYR